MRRGPAAPGFEPPPKAVAAYHFRVRRLVAQPKAVVHHAPAAALHRLNQGYDNGSDGGTMCGGMQNHLYS